MVNWLISWAVLVTGLFLVCVQGATSWMDGYLSQKQMKKELGIYDGWSFLQHGGMWADVFIVSPLVAYILGRVYP